MAAELPESGMVALCVAIGKAMVAELPVPVPEAGVVAICVALGKAMASELPEAGMVALHVAIGCAVILLPLLSLLQRSPARGPVVVAAVLFITLTLPMAYLAVVILLYTPVSALVVMAALRQYVLVCAPLVLLFVPFIFFLTAGGW